MNFICLNLRQWQKEVGHHAPGLNESELQLSWVESASYFYFFFFVQWTTRENGETERDWREGKCGERGEGGRGRVFY